MPICEVFPCNKHSVSMAIYIPVRQSHWTLHPASHMPSCTLLLFARGFPFMLFLKSLTVLFVENSDITGKIPTEIGKLEVLKTLAFAFNTQLSGTFPTELHTLPSINELYLTNTGITGTVDPLVCDISKNNNVPKIGGEYLADCLQGTPKVTCTCCDMCCGATKCCDYVGDDGCFPLTEYWDD
uniref:LNR domain-containing protein n=1 Tax=Craspedostauros australis TaxID=1486917 RepID=A0A7S0F7F1_9STRA|mmetsp:Transcript_9796/g.26705  ORF Transcript_9796/g.26705 Transcript_9796/m.26705 type:complete len:183 (+) Transcript_9796:36-584(+)